MKKLLLLLFILPYFSFGQNQSIVDSLRNAYELEAADTNKIKILHLIAGEVYLTQPDTAITVCEQALEQAEKANYFYGMMASYGWLSYLWGEKGKKFKAANFRKLILSVQSENMQQQKEIIDKAFENWRGELEQIDDICVIGIKI